MGSQSASVVGLSRRRLERFPALRFRARSKKPLVDAPWCGEEAGPLHLGDPSPASLRLLIGRRWSRKTVAPEGDLRKKKAHMFFYTLEYYIIILPNILGQRYFRPWLIKES